MTYGTPLCNSAQLRAIESANVQIDLMRRAGKAAADFLLERSTPDCRVVLFVGPGNNGGDALACAVELVQAGYAPTVVLLGDPEKFDEDAARALRRVVELQDSSDTASSDPSSLASERRRIVMTRTIPAQLAADWVVDGLFGIGLKRPLRGVFREAVDAIAAARAIKAKVLALDVPSGVDADTGAIVGEAAVHADFTLTFIAGKPGLVTGPALDFVGELHCSTLGLPQPTVGAAYALDSGYIDATRPLSRSNVHKGSQGTCVIVGGANGMLGAVLLASRAAMRNGAGKVRVGWLAEPYPQVDPLMPEVMMGSAADWANADCQSMVVGCGLGVSGAAVRTLKSVLKREVPMVIDADALNLIAQAAELATLVQRRKAPTIITPHPAEAARLLGCSTADVQRNRLKAAHDLANGYRCIAVLKGAGTVVSDGKASTVNVTGNPLLATAGTGDVLAGMIGALLANGYEAATAARLAVCTHGAAADAMRARGIKRAVAGDVIDELRML